MAMATRAAKRAALLEDYTERLLQVATCMAMCGFGEAVGGLTGMARAFYGDAVLWAVHKGHRGPRGRTRLMYAAMVKDVARARFLLAQGAAVDVVDANLATALMYACEAGALEVAHCLVERGASVNAVRGGGGQTALMYACENGHPEVARCLLAHGADVHAARTDYGKTALMLACEFGHLEIVQCLVEHGANVNAAMKRGMTALMWACYKGHAKVVRLLLQRGADPQLQTDGGSTAHSYAQSTPIHALLPPYIPQAPPLP